MAASYEVTSVNEEQIPDPSGSGDLIDVFDITFTIPNRPGTFTVQVPESGAPVTAAYDAISTKVAEVQAIYGGGTS
jgi:hypothetical protein